MARDYAKKRGSKSRSTGAKRNNKKQSPAISGWRWYGAGLLSGLFISLLLYLGTLAPEPPAGEEAQQAAAEPAPPKPRFDFYTVLPEQTIEVEADPEQVARNRAQQTQGAEFYLLQAGSFRQRDDADRRRAELLLLGLEPRVEETQGDNGRWFRVYLGPFDSRSKMAKARSLTAAQDIDTLLLKRRKNG